MTDPTLAVQVYVVKQFCDALLSSQPMSDPKGLMKNMRTEAQMVASNAPDNPAIAAINDKVAAAFEEFKAGEYRMTSGVTQKLAEIATDVLAEAGRLYPEVFSR